MLRRTHIRNYVITKHRSAVLDGIRSARVVLIQAPTGSGKSTQVPQYILNEWKDARILHTQPRKLSTLLLSRRVAEERGASVGEEVGYAYRGGHACRDDTALLYCTTGVALEVLSRPQRAGSKLTHVIVDEVHERSVFVDLLFVLLRTRLPDVKVVLMSATADAATLTSYFGGETQCPTLQCGAGPAEHPVAIEYLEAAAGVIQRAERTPSDLRSATVNETAERLLRALVASGGVRAGHSVLIFLATVGEVVQLSKNLEDLETADGVTVTVSQLYSANKYAASQQLTLLHKGPQMNSIFIYVATNVAETGLTLPHVSHVIDTGLVLQKMYDAHQNLHRYEKGPISVKSSLQRSGRTGRTCPGTVYRLWKADKQLPAETPPDVTTTKLDVTALKMISFGYGNVEEIMSKMPTAPAAFAVESAVANLASLGLVVQKECEWVLTDLGTAVAGLPVEPALGRLLLLSAFLGCVEPALMIVAAATKMTQTASHHVAGSQLHFGSSSASDAFRDLNSDLLVHAQLYRAYTRQLERGPSNADLQKTFRLHPGLMPDIKVTIGTLRKNLKQRGWLASYVPNHGVDSEFMRALTVYSYPRHLARGYTRRKQSKQWREFEHDSASVWLHSSSIVRHASPSVNEGVYTFMELVKTSRKCMFGVTEVSPLAVLLFGGPDHGSAQGFRFDVPDKERVLSLRRRLFESFDKFCSDPSAADPDRQQLVEEVTQCFKRPSRLATLLGTRL